MKHRKQFREIQRLDLKWLIMSALVLALPLAILLYLDKPYNAVNIVLTVLLPLTLLYTLYAIRLKTIIDPHRIRIKFFPLANRNISWDDVKSVEIVNYGLTSWGVVKSPTWGTIYNTRGTVGLLVELKNSERLVIGTQHPEALSRFLMNCIEIEEA